MKEIRRTVVFLSIFTFVLSCNFQKKQENNDVKSSSIDKVLMISKGGDGRHKLKKRMVITDKDEIVRLSNTFLSSTPLNHKVNVGANYGSIVVDMVDKKSESVHYLSIIYTVYDGVVIRNDLNGDKFKNDEFAGHVDNLMSDDEITLETIKNGINDKE